MACLTMLDRLQLSPHDLAMTSMIDVDPTTLPPEHYKDQFANPMTYDEAWNHSCPFQREKWREAIHKEFRKMNEQKVWTVQKKSAIPAGRRLVKCKWVFEIKRDGKFRARLVACGYSQVHGVDYNQVFSPVVNDVTFRIMLIAKMMWKLDSYQFDVETAFLLGDLEEEIYMECPPGMNSHWDECLRLWKCIYGLVQAARQFYKHWASIMVKLGFRISAADPCLFSRGMAQTIIIICLHVDDGFSLGKVEELLHFFKQLEAYLKFITEESMGDYLSCEVKFNEDKTRAWLGQPHMIKKIEKVFGEKVARLREYKTPGTPGFGIVRPKDDSERISSEMQSEYMSGVGMLLYLVKYSRPDIANAVRELTKCMDGATPAAYKEMLRLVKFVLCIKTWRLKIMPKSPDGTMEWNLVTFSDSDWEGDKDNRRSINGFIIFLCGVPIVWRSKQQKTVVLSLMRRSLLR